MRELTKAVGLVAGFLSLTSAADVNLRTHNAPGYTDADTHLAIRRGLAEARHQKRDDLGGSVTLDKSWNGAVLLKFGASKDIDTGNNASSASVNVGVEITCTTCYVKGLASAHLHIPDDFNATEAVRNTTNSVFGELKNFTEEVQDYMWDYFKQVGVKLQDGPDLDDFAFPTLNTSFDVDIPTIDDVTLNFQFDDMELYLELNTVLGAGATYELNLYTSNSPIGIGVGSDLTLGVVFKVDLLLSVEGTIDISSGLHIKLDDGVAIDIALFSDSVSNLVFNGGQFEFLPVTVENAGVVLSAMLRIGIHSGLEVVAPSIPGFEFLNKTMPGLPRTKGGIEVGVYANLAEFTTNVTLAPKDSDCAFKVVQEYQIALGAIAGASVAFASETWGPVAQTSIPIWNTALAEVCASKATKTGTPAPATSAPTPARKRDDSKSETITTETEITHTRVQCRTSVIGNCPNSQQITSQTVQTTTLTTVVPKGKDRDIEWPKTPGVTPGVTQTKDFGQNALSFSATSGSPTSYTPPPTPSSSDEDGSGDGNEGKVSEVVNGKTGGASNKLIIGLSVGLGVPILIGVVVAIVLLRRRKAYNAVPAPTFAPDHLVAEPYQRVGSHSHSQGQGDGFEPYRWEKKGKLEPSVDITEIRR